MNGAWQDVTVIIPAHDAAITLDACLASVAAQTVQPGEVIVVDDRSSDATVELARRRGAVVVATSGASGAGAARNVGLRAASSEWCAFLDSDDEWFPDHLATIHVRAVARQEVALWMSGSVRLDDAGRPGGIYRAAAEEAAVAPLGLLMLEVRPTTSATVVRRQPALAVGGFDESEMFKPASCEDLDLWLRLSADYPVVALPAVTVRYRVSDGRRPAAQMALNEQARVVTVERALRRAGLGGKHARRVWAVTWTDLGKWHLKHGGRRAARRAFFRAVSSAPERPSAGGWLALSLLPEAAVRRLRRAYRRAAAHGSLLG